MAGSPCFSVIQPSDESPPQSQLRAGGPGGGGHVLRQPLLYHNARPAFGPVRIDQLRRLLKGLAAFQTPPGHEDCNPRTRSGQHEQRVANYLMIRSC
jgi:hypothetical protein